jgi:type IX secretion system PorP/SprF family membrane protein
MNLIKLNILFLLVSSIGFSQQTITNNQYYLFDYFYNPSLSGGESNNPLYINYIDQWVGFENSPTKITAGFNFSSNSNNGFSILFNQNNQGGSFKEDQLNFNYSKQIFFNKENKLSLGLGVFASQNTTDFSNISTALPNDNIFTTSANEIILDGSFGLNFSNKNFEIGISSLYLNNSNLEITKNQYPKSFRNRRQYYLISSYSFRLNEKISLIPNILFNFLSKDFFLRSYSLLANFNKTFIFGLANRNYATNLEASENHPNYRNLTLAFILGYEFKKFCTYYTYEISKNISFPTHELTVGCKFEKLKKNRFIEIDFQYPLPEKKKSFNYPNTKSDKVLVKNEKALEVSESSDEEFALKDSSELDSINSKYSLHLFPDVNFDDLSLRSENENNDYIFEFEKLTTEQINDINLIIVDANGNKLSTGVKTEDGFTFSKISNTGEYFYKLENMPDSIAVDFMEINIVESGVSKKIVASLIYEEKVLEVSETNDEEAKLEDSSLIQIKTPTRTVGDSNLFEKYFHKFNFNDSNKYKSDKNVEFSFDNYSITPSYIVFLDSLIEFIELHKNISVIIEGHTDNIGSEQYNMFLSQRRATSVLNYLTEKGIDKKILTAKGLGEVKPIASNANPSGRALNRRTEIYIIYLKTKE